MPVERRRKPTPKFGWYSFFGRRKEDRYSAPLFFLLVSITGLNVLDSLFTMMILDLKGWEANPVVRSVTAGATTPEQVEANAKGCEWRLTRQDMEDVRAFL